MSCLLCEAKLGFSKAYKGGTAFEEKNGVFTINSLIQNPTYIYLVTKNVQESGNFFFFFFIYFITISTIT